MKTLKILIIILTLTCFITCRYSMAEETLTQKVENYLNSIKTFKADFVQTTNKKQTSSGRFFLKRPGRLKFEYNSPINDFIVADGSLIHYYDAEMEEHSSAPIKDTLAYFLLKDKIDLSNDMKPSQVVETDKTIEITIIKNDENVAGSLVMYFKKNPLSLQKWKVKDVQGLETTVTLKNIASGVKLNNEQFYYYDPSKKKNFSTNK